MLPPAVDVVRGMVHRGVDGLQVERGLTGRGKPLTKASHPSSPPKKGSRFSYGLGRNSGRFLTNSTPAPQNFEIQENPILGNASTSLYMESMWVRSVSSWETTELPLLLLESPAM